MPADGRDARDEIDAAQPDETDAMPDTEPPTVTLTSPSDGAAAVDTATVVSAVFSEPLAVESVTAGTFQVLAGGEPVAGTLAVDGPVATFFPDARLTPDTAYTATLTTGIADRAGNALAAEVSWSFTTREGGWSAPRVLENELDKRSDELDVDQAGNFAIAAWIMTPCNGSTCGPDAELWASIYENGAWSPAESVPTGSSDVLGPRVAIDSTGNAMVVWYQDDGSHTSIAASRYTPGSGWSPGVVIEAEQMGNAQFPKVAIDASGNAYVVWQQDDGTTTNVWSNTYVAASGWKSASKIESRMEAAHKPDVVATDSGTVVSVWMQGGQVWANTNDNGDWNSPTLVSESGSFALPVTLEGEGDHLLAVWPSDDDVYASRYTGAWTAAAVIDGQSTMVSSGMDLAVDANGDAIAVWIQGGAGAQHVWHARFLPAGGWGSASRVETNGGQANRPGVAFGPGGTAMASWQQPSGSNTSIWANTFDPSAGWRAPHLVETDDTGAAGEPAIFFDPGTGSFIAVWTQGGPGYASTYWSRFE